MGKKHKEKNAITKIVRSMVIFWEKIASMIQDPGEDLGTWVVVKV